MRLAERKGIRITLVRQTIHDWATGITQSHHLGAFVESLSRSVVDRLADHLHIIISVHLYDLRVTARNQQAKERKRGSMVIVRSLLDKMSQHVSL